MNLSAAMAAGAFAASVFLLLQLKTKGAVFLALAVSLMEILLHTGFVHLGIRGVPLHLVLGGLLGVAGIVLYAQVVSKIGAGASTVIVLTGLLQVLSSLGLVF